MLITWNFLALSSHFSVQVKSYAKVHGQINENDKGYVSILYSLHYVAGSYFIEDTLAQHVYRLSLLITFIFLNILTPVALAKSVSLYYPRIRAKSSTGDFIGCLYWATAVVTFLINVLYTAASIRHTFWSKLAITNCFVHPMHLLYSIQCKCLQRWSLHCTCCIYNHSKLGFHRIVSFCFSCFSLSEESETCWSMSFS